MTTRFKRTDFNQITASADALRKHADGLCDQLREAYGTGAVSTRQATKIVMKIDDLRAALDFARYS